MYAWFWTQEAGTNAYEATGEQAKVEAANEQY